MILTLEHRRRNGSNKTISLPYPCSRTHYPQLSKINNHVYIQALPNKPSSIKVAAYQSPRKKFPALGRILSFYSLRTYPMLCKNTYTSDFCLLRSLLLGTTRHTFILP